MRAILIKLLVLGNSKIRIPFLRFVDKFKKHNYIDSDPNAWIVPSVFTEKIKKYKKKKIDNNIWLQYGGYTHVDDAEKGFKKLKILSKKDFKKKHNL